MKKKIIVFVETGEDRPPKSGDYYLNGEAVLLATDDHWNHWSRTRSILARHILEIDAGKPATVEVEYTPGARVWRECPGEPPKVGEKYIDDRTNLIGIRREEGADGYHKTVQRLAESRDPAKVTIQMKGGW